MFVIDVYVDSMGVRKHNILVWFLFIYVQDSMLITFPGEQDDRVFTLAEQIIAAMPERIKVRIINWKIAKKL